MPRRDRDRRPARRSAFREARKRILVVTEGSVTEPTYITGFAHAHRHPLIHVVIAKPHGDPSFIVLSALDEKRAADRAANASRDENIRFDEVWCVFDRDEHTHFAAAIDEARANGLEVAASNPCFELWLLLHLRESPGARDRQGMQKLLRDALPGYAKAPDVARLMPGYEAAVKRADRLDREGVQRGESYGNPSTGVHRLTESIRTG